ncbi:hypothetical protein EJB05_36399, partial [Eragrostis curvula]
MSALMTKYRKSDYRIYSVQAPHAPSYPLRLGDLLYETYCEMMRLAYRDFAIELNEENKRCSSSDRIPVRVAGRLFTPKDGIFLVPIIPKEAFAKILTLLFRKFDLYFGSYHYDGVWYMLEDCKADELPPQEQLPYTRIVILSGITTRYESLGGFGSVGPLAFDSLYNVLSNTADLYRSEAGRAILQSGHLALPPVAISEAMRFRIHQKFVKRALKDGKNRRIPKFLSRDFAEWGDYSTAMYKKKPPPSCRYSVDEIKRRMGILKRRPMDEVKPGDQYEKAPAEILRWHEKDQKRLLHASCEVQDLELSVSYYRDCFEMSKLRQEEEGCASAVLGFQSESSSFALELMQDTKVKKSRPGNGFGHLSIEHKDVEKVVNAVKLNCGNQDTIYEGSSDPVAVDPDGIKVQILQGGLAPACICKVMLYVGNLDRAIKFYQTGLGMILLTRENKKKYAYARLGYNDGGTVLELTSKFAISRYDKGNRYIKLTIGTEDVHRSEEAVSFAVATFGGKILQRPGVLPGSSTKTMSFIDPDGWKVELIDAASFLKNEVREPRKAKIDLLANNSGIGGGEAESGKQELTSAPDNVASRSSVSGTGMPSTNSNQKQPVASSSVNKQMVADGPIVPSQSSSGFQHGWSGMPGQLSMADIVKRGRPQAKHSSKPVVTADRGYTGQYPSLPSTVNQNSKHYANTASQTEHNQVPPLKDSVQVKNRSHSAVGNKHAYGNDWTPQDEPPHANQLFLPETPVDPYETSLQSSSQVDNVVHLHANSHFDENNTVAMRPVASERHLERGEVNSEYNDGTLTNSSSYQPQKYSYTKGKGYYVLSLNGYSLVPVFVYTSQLTHASCHFEASADVSAATANFQSLSLQSEELAAKRITEDNPAVIIPDHLQVTNTECACLSFGSFEPGAFPGFLPQKTTDSNVELSVGGESAPADQIDARNQDYYDTVTVPSSANENLEAMIGDNMDNVDAPSVSQADALRQDVLDPSGLQYDLPSMSSHAYSHTNTSQPSTMEGPQGNIQAHTLSHLSNLMQANPLSTSLLGSNQSTLHDLEYPLPPYLAPKYNTDLASNPRPAICMQETLKTGLFPDAQSTQNLPSSSIPTGPPPPQQLAAPAHPYSQHTVPLPPFANMIGYPYLPQNYATYLPSIFQLAYLSNGPFHQSAVPGSGMKYSMQEYKNTLSAAGLQQQPSSVISGYGGFGISSNLPGNFTLNQNMGSASSTLGFDDALSRQYKDASQYMSLQQGDNSAMGLHGSGSRTAAALPPSHFYGYNQGQSQQGGFRQAQQPQPSQFGGHGYPTYYSSQGGLAQEQHTQNLAEGCLNGFQTAQSQPSHPAWKHQHTF